MKQHKQIVSQLRYKFYHLLQDQYELQLNMRLQERLNDKLYNQAQAQFWSKVYYPVFSQIGNIL